MTDTTISQARDHLQQLRALIDRLSNTVTQQQQTLKAPRVDAITLRADVVTQTALRESAELTRLITHARSALDDLDRRVKEQQSERDQMRALQNVGAAINSSLELPQVLRMVMDAIINLTQAERALLLLVDENSGRLEVQVARNVDQETIVRSESFKISRSIVRKVKDSGEPIVTLNAQEDARFSGQDSIISYRLRSILCVPLKIKANVIGVIYTDNRIADGMFDDADRDLLAGFANQAAMAIENARLFRQIRNHLIEITELNELMDNVFESIASGVITIDESDRIALYNKAAERILGVSAKTVLHKAYETVLTTLGLPVESLVRDVQQNGGTHNTELDINLQKTPGISTLNLTFSPLRDVQQETLGVALVLDDISEKKRLESVRRYLPPELVDQIRDLDAAQRPQRRMLSVMFADVRGFSTFGEHVTPELLIEAMNGYFTEAVQAIKQYQGLTDKFMGDAVMALFNTPLNPQANHVDRAVRTALMMRRNTAVYNATLPPEQRLHFGIGVHMGEAVVGNVGSTMRKDYSAIGDAVNLAKRLQELAEPNQIVISQAVYEQVCEWVQVKALSPVQVKGRQTLEQTYLLLEAFKN